MDNRDVSRADLGEIRLRYLSFVRLQLVKHLQTILELHVKMIERLNPSLVLQPFPVSEGSTKSIRDLLSLIQEAQAIICQEAHMHLITTKTLALLKKDFKNLGQTTERVSQELEVLWSQHLKIETLSSNVGISNATQKGFKHCNIRNSLRSLQEFLEETQLRLLLINTDLESRLLLFYVPDFC